MPLFKKKPVTIEAITFDELVAHGFKEYELNGRVVEYEMPWCFRYRGHPITHDSDNCYIILTLEGSMHFRRGDMLITGVNGEIYPCKIDIFEKTYVPAAESNAEVHRAASAPVQPLVGQPKINGEIQ